MDREFLMKAVHISVVVAAFAALAAAVAQCYIVTAVSVLWMMAVALFVAWGFRHGD